ncbi:transporter substrate-binding domain-containing protein [Castellaniella sp. S9]|uniref:transporter substrate-binding domain-containing protein n=1 Tax=Castellaniella sp. S9 TaxID=2993652 RepID=UPI0022B4907D|nr:transporter substrate-binding domain-containing protein [Castellaniella sp. S9]
MKDSTSFRPVNPIRRLLLGAAATLALGATLAPSAHAQSVDAVKASGVLKAGVQVAQVPWGFTDAQGKLTGFEVEFVRMVAQDLGVQPQIVPVTPANRTAALLTGQVDMLAAVMGIFPDRQKVVLFTRPYAVNENVVIAKAGPQMKGWEDLKGMRIGVPRGTPQDKALTDANPPDTKLMRFDDDAATVQALVSGQVDAIGAAITQVGNLAQVAGPGTYESRLVLSRVYNGVAVRPGEREWVDYLNGLIGRKIADGELSALYKKWIGNDLPPNMPDTGEGDAPLPAIVTK